MFAQHLAFSSNNIHLEAAFSIRPIVSGYLPPYENILGEAYQVHDVRGELTRNTICSLPDSLLENSIDPVLLITNDFFCAYETSNVSPGSVILVPVDSNELATASLPHFDEEDDNFGPVYVFAISNEAMNSLGSIISNLDSIVFYPNNNPIFSNYGNTPTYHVSEDMSFRLPCTATEPFTVAATLLPDCTLEVAINADSSNIYFTGFLEFGRGFFDTKSFRNYSQTYEQNIIQFNVISGELGDQISFKPRCEGIDSFSVSVDVEQVDTTSLCAIQTNFAFKIITSDDTLVSFENAEGENRLSLPFDSRPVIFESAVDSLEELPSGRPPKYRPYYAYDDWFFDLVIASQAGCDALNSDLNGGGTITTTSEIPDSKSVEQECVFELDHSTYSCLTHEKSEVQLLSYHIPLELYLPHTLDIAHCIIGNQGAIVPKGQD